MRAGSDRPECAVADDGDRPHSGRALYSPMILCLPNNKARAGLLPDIIAKADRRAYRLTSVDMLRGLVVVIMALDPF